MRPRHRNDRVASQITRDSAGREHLLLNFFVQGQDPSKPILRESDSRWDAAVDWATQQGTRLSEMTYDEMVDSTKQYSGEVWDRCKRLFRFLSGEPVPSSKATPSPPPEQREEKREGGWTSGLMGMFAGLKGHGRDASNAPEDVPEGQFYTDGEVHADLIMVSPCPSLPVRADPESLGRMSRVSTNFVTCASISQASDPSFARLRHALIGNFLFTQIRVRPTRKGCL